MTRRAGPGARERHRDSRTLKTWLSSGIAVGPLLAVDASTRLFGVARTSRGLAKVADRLPRVFRKQSPTFERKAMSFARTLRRAARALVWGGDCLPRALVLWTWLRWSGEEATVVLGVRRDGEGIVSHAWVEWRGEKIGEVSDVDDEYTVFPHALAVETP